MSFSAGTNLILGVIFVIIGLVAAVLQYWLWTFPMAPDPSGTDPNGVTTAPRPWRMVHRVLGYAFVAIYLALMTQMIPRLWSYDSEAWGAGQIIHAALGVAIGGLLVGKIVILRRLQRFGNRLRMIGTLVLLSAVAVVALTARPGFALIKHPGDDVARAIVLRNCTQCHGLSRIFSEDEDIDKWLEILSEMKEKAHDKGLSDPTENQEDRLALFLSNLATSKENGQEDHKDSDRRKPRGRDR